MPEADKTDSDAPTLCSNGLPCVSERPRPQQGGFVWKHGVADFEGSGGRMKYILVPPGLEDPAELLRAMCRIWSLSMPSLLVNVDGGYNLPARWYDDLLDPESWKEYTGGGDRESRHAYGDALNRTFIAVVSACAEGQAWIWSGGDNMGGSAYEGKTAWLGYARRHAPEGNKVVHLAAYHEDEFGPLWGMEKFQDLAVLEGKEVERHVWYPDIQRKYRTRDEHGMEQYTPAGCEEGLPNGAQVLIGACTHLIIHPKGCPLPRHMVLRTLQKIVPAAGLGVHGRQGMAWHWAMQAQHAPFIVLRHTGGAADILAEAHLRRNAPTRAERIVSYKRANRKDRTAWDDGEGGEEGSFCLPSTVQEGRIVVVDPMRDSTDRIVEKVLQCISLVEDVEAQQIGAKDMEQHRLTEAWELQLELKMNADTQLCNSNIIQYSILIMSVATAFLAVLYEQMLHCDENGCLPPRWMSVLKWSVSLLPLVSAFFMSCNSRFSPHIKWAQLAFAASAVETEIYEYRARVGEYLPRFGSNFFKDDAASQLSPSNASKAKLKDRHLFAMPEPQETRRGTFSLCLEEIERQVMNGEVKKGSLKPLPPGSFQAFQQGLIDRLKVDPEVDSSRKPLLPYHGSGKYRGASCDIALDDGLSTLSAEDYINFRLRPTLARFRNRAPELERQIMFCQVCIFLATSANAVLALLSQQLDHASMGTRWMPVVIAFTSAVSAAMEYEMLNSKLMYVNNALLDLNNVLVWWASLSLVEKRTDTSKQYLVDMTEGACSAELSWAKSLRNKRKPKQDAQSKLPVSQGIQGSSSVAVLGSDEEMPSRMER